MNNHIDLSVCVKSVKPLNYSSTGFSIYFLYGIRHSSLNESEVDERTVLYSKVSERSSDSED